MREQVVKEWEMCLEEINTFLMLVWFLESGCLFYTYFGAQILSNHSCSIH